jgi:diguanylate cyclase (GGDEF)-like protein
MDAKGNTLVCASPILEPEAIVDRPENPSLLHYLIVVRGGIPGTMLRLSQSTSSLGRGPDCTFQIHENSVSRRHALLSTDASGFAWITDMGSTNGTLVDGQRIPAQTPWRIRDGSRIQLGSSVLLKFLKLDACDEGFQREMYERTVRDGLTGLYNRSYFLNQIGPLAEQNAMQELGLAVIMVDLDHFKRINDTYGHDFGDHVLREAATVLRESTRSEDLVARYGGEEFVVALPTATLHQAAERAERIRAQIAGRHLEADGIRVRVTASLGLSYVSARGGKTIASLISSADQALYDAKRTGRNRVALARSSDPGPACTRKTESADAIIIL